MSHSRPTHRIPRGRLDAIRCEADALAVLALGAPYGHDTIAIPLDAERRGRNIVHVTDTTEPDALFRVLDLCLEAFGPDIDALILASSRPGGGIEAPDCLRWVEASLQCDDVGIELVEWFVIGRTITFPRDLAGDPPRWP